MLRRTRFDNQAGQENARLWEGHKGLLVRR